MRALKRRITEAHRQTGRDIKLQLARRLFNQFKRLRVGYPRMLMVQRFMMMGGQIGIDLRTCAIHDNQPNAEAVKKAYVVNNAGKVFVFYRFAAQHDDKRFTPVGINIRD